MVVIVRPGSAKWPCTDLYDTYSNVNILGLLEARSFGTAFRCRKGHQAKRQAWLLCFHGAKCTTAHEVKPRRTWTSPRSHEALRKGWEPGLYKAPTTTLPGPCGWSAIVIFLWKERASDPWSLGIPALKHESIVIRMTKSFIWIFVAALECERWFP